MEKIWAGRSDGIINKTADDFNSSISVDCRMWKEDITGSMAHAAMLSAKGIISESDADLIIDGLDDIFNELKSGKLKIDMSVEDIHTFIEQTLTERIGDAGKRLHTARSRNDQVALDLRLYLNNAVKDIKEKTKNLILAITTKAEKYKSAVMPGYTHLQRAQPVTFGHHLMAYSMMFLRDLASFVTVKVNVFSTPA